MERQVYHCGADDRRTEDLLQRAEAVLTGEVHLARGEAKGIMRELACRLRRGRASTSQVARIILAGLVALGRADS